jgi:hypothetical protein
MKKLKESGNKLAHTSFLNIHELLLHIENNNDFDEYREPLMICCEFDVFLKENKDFE